MYPNNEAISIVQVSNGWIVTLPYMPSMPMQIGPTPMSEKEIRRQAKIMKDEMLGDPILKKIQEENYEPEPSFEPIEPKIIDLKINNVHIFTKFEEVLEFLKQKIK